MVLPCVLRHLTDKLIDNFRFSLSAQVLTPKSPSETDGSGGRGKTHKANLLQIQHNESWVTLSHLSGLGAPAQTCAGGFIVLGPDMAGNLVVVLDHMREDLWVCAPTTNVQVEEGKMNHPGWGGTCSCLTSYLTL